MLSYEMKRTVEILQTWSCQKAFKLYASLKLPQIFLNEMGSIEF